MIAWGNGGPRPYPGRLTLTNVDVAAVVGISGGGPTAVTIAARHPDLVERLVLVSAVGWLPYPDRATRLGVHVVFAAGAESMTWAAIHALAPFAACLPAAD